MPLADRALTILHEWVQSESLRKHCYAVADSMKHFAQLRGEDADLWEAVGLLHDMDYERHPNLEQSANEGHPFVGAAWLRQNGWSDGSRPTRHRRNCPPLARSVYQENWIHCIWALNTRQRNYDLPLPEGQTEFHRG